MSFVFVFTFQFISIISVCSFNNIVENRSRQGSDPENYEQRIIYIIIIHLPLVIIYFCYLNKYSIETVSLHDHILEGRHIMFM